MTIKMNLAVAIKQNTFKSEKEKALLNLMYTSSWIGMQQIRFFKQFGLSPQQYNVLRILRGQYPNSATVSLIQERMLDKMSNASRLVEKLKQRGLVNRDECPLDRRQVDVLINTNGLNLLNEIDNKRTDIEELLGNLKLEEAQNLNELLDKLRTNN